MSRLFNRSVVRRTPVVAILAVLALPSSQATAATFSHDEWTQVLQQFVDDQGLVDYEGLAGDRSGLDRYLARVETTGPRSAPELFADRKQELAYYLNAYNAQVFAGVLDRGTDIESVWSGGLISGYSFFVRRKVLVDGTKMSLKSLEDDIVREDFKDPRIHAALNCASIGCPRLPRQAFLGETLEEQLDAAMQEFVTDPRHVSVDSDNQEVSLSKIFDWFEDDFVDYLESQGNRRGSILDYVNRYRANKDPLPEDWDVEYLSYDKGLNRQTV